MKGKVKITLGVVALCIMMTGCYKNPPSCSCAEKYPQMDEPYAPSWFTVSWSDFNPLIKVQQYLCYHDSTLREHDGDTIMLYGYVNQWLATGGFLLFLQRGKKWGRMRLPVIIVLDN